MAATPETFPGIFNQSSQQVSGTTLVAGIGLSSFSALLLELALTRLFSVVLFYHFAFLAISIALLGLGAGGVYAHVRQSALRSYPLRSIAFACAAMTAIAIPIALEIVLHLPVSLTLSGGNFIRLTAIYGCAAVPFFLAGLQFSVIFARESSRIPRLYGADLTGGAIACVAVVPLLNWIGAPNAILFSALTAALAAVVWSPMPRAKKQGLALAGAVVTLMIANHSGRLFDVVWAKGIHRDNVEFARWNAISRVEVDRAADGAKVVVIDADANSYIMNADPRYWEGSKWQELLMSSPAAVVNAIRPHGDYAIIGPGGGVDVLRAVANGSPNVIGIEINPIIANTIMRDKYADYSYNLYRLPQVHLHVGDGRSFIRNAPAQYDVVEMTLVDTWASTAAGAFALAENNLYTTQAFREYFEHLKPDGMVAVTRWEFQVPREALRVVSVAATALHESGVQDVSHHFVVVAQDALDEDGVNVSVLAKKSEFTGQEENAIRQYVALHSPLQLLYLPSEPQDNAFRGLIRSNDPYAFSHNYAYNVSPVTDNAPFFFFTTKLGNLLRPGPDNAMDWKVNLGVAVLAMLLLISVLAVAAFLLLPLIVSRSATRQPAAALLYFVAVGLGYILVEVTFIQRFVLFLGHPTYALTVVIFLLLLSSGAGSFLSRKCLAQSRRVWVPLALISAALIIYMGVLPGLLGHFVGAPFTVKLLISAALLVPLGFAMGMPFPTGLRALAESADANSEPNSIEWAWAMNAASSVLGSVLAIVIAIQFGLNVTLTCAAAAYLIALLLNPKLHWHTSPV
ncbi:MAG TPA: class I SAM-dependent methyltransferase [Terriglobales bacterium]|nr:class I SAM-dependent methyltransferase [Terriglobales bacterium]